MNRNLSLILVIFISLLVSCSQKDELSVMMEIKLIPYQGTVNGKWGFIDNQGRKVIDTIFDAQPTYFKEGYALVRKPDGLQYFINEKGEFKNLNIIDATLFHEGLACIVRENDAPEYINTELKTVFKLNDAIFAGTFSDGLAKFQDKNGKWGYIDKEGKIAIKPQFDFVSSFKQGLARIHKLEGEKATSWIIDKQGNKVFDVPVGVQTMGYYNDNVSVFNDTTGWGIYDLKGVKILSGKKDWEMLGDFFYGFASFLKGDKWGVINTRGDIVIDPKYENNLIFANGLSAVSTNGKWGFMDIEGKMKIDFQYDGIFIPFFSETALVKKGSELLLIDKDGKKVNDSSVPFVNVSLEYDELLNIDKYLQTDIFDIKGLIDSLIGTLNTQSINNLNGGSDFASVQNFVKSKGLQYVLTAQSITVPQARTGMISYSYIIDFTKPIANKDSRFRSIEISIFFPQAMARKLNVIYNSLKSLVMKSGFKLDMEDAVSYLTSSDVSTAAILKMNSQLVFSFVMKDKKAIQTAGK